MYIQRKGGGELKEDTKYGRRAFLVELSRRFRERQGGGWEEWNRCTREVLDRRTLTHHPVNSILVRHPGIKIFCGQPAMGLEIRSTFPVRLFFSFTYLLFNTPFAFPLFRLFFRKIPVSFWPFSKQAVQPAIRDELVWEDTVDYANKGYSDQISTNVSTILKLRKY